MLTWVCVRSNVIDDAIRFEQANPLQPKGLKSATTKGLRAQSFSRSTQQQLCLPSLGKEDRKGGGGWWSIFILSHRLYLPFDSYDNFDDDVPL